MAVTTIPPAFAEPDPGHVLAVQTCVGREELFAKTMDALDAAGADVWPGRKIVVADGYGPERHWGHMASTGDTRIGHAQTLFKLLKLAAVQPGFTCLTLFEDDILPARNALHYIARARIPNDSLLLSWFSWEGWPAGDRPIMTRAPSTAYFGTQAVSIPARTVHSVITWLTRNHWPTTFKNNGDLVFSYAAPAGHCLYHRPSLVQHVSLTSMVMDAAPPKSPEFFEGDCLDLLRTTL